MISREDFFHIFFVPEFRDALVASPFREVFLLTNMKDGTVFIPLKMLLLMAEASSFNAIYTETQAYRRFDPQVAELEVFGSYLATMVKGTVLFREGEYGTEIMYGDGSLLVARDKSTYVRMHHDEPFPGNARAPGTNLSSHLGADFMHKLAEYKSFNTFVNPLVVPTKSFEA
jgi:hypothetical protein